MPCKMCTWALDMLLQLGWGITVKFFIDLEFNSLFCNLIVTGSKALQNSSPRVPHFEERLMACCDLNQYISTGICLLK